MCLYIWVYLVLIYTLLQLELLLRIQHYPFSGLSDRSGWGEFPHLARNSRSFYTLFQSYESKYSFNMCLIVSSGGFCEIAYGIVSGYYLSLLQTLLLGGSYPSFHFFVPLPVLLYMYISMFQPIVITYLYILTYIWNLVLSFWVSEAKSVVEVQVSSVCNGALFAGGSRGLH